MERETIEFLKWVVGLPAAFAAIVTLPFVIRKYHLECRKLALEIQQISGIASDPRYSSKPPSRLFTWFANYWVIPCYGSLGLFLVVTFITHSGVYFAAGSALSLLFFVWGSAAQDRYHAIRAQMNEDKHDE